MAVFKRLASFCLAFLALADSAGAAEPVAHRLDLAAGYRSGDYEFIGRAVGDRPVVALGESIHLTREFPLARLNLVRFLHEQRGMDVLAFEGSLVDAWTAQEHAYRGIGSPDERARRFAREALFGLWQTDEMVQLVAYALGTQRGPRPLYIASFDVQPGTSRAYGGSSRRSIEAFLATLTEADPQLQEAQVRSWAQSLGPALDCDATPGQDAVVGEVEQWIATRADEIFGTARPAPHLQTLRLVPLMIRSRLRLCDEWNAAERDRDLYQRRRDVLSAELVLALRRSMPRMFLWAHHSHLHHNSLGRAVPSMGQHLKAALGDDLYTIGVFAAGGRAIDSTRLDSAGMIRIVTELAGRPLPMDDRFGVERRLAAHSKGDFFVDLTGASGDWARPDFSRLEVDGRMATALSRDFDAALLIRDVSGAELSFLPAPLRRAVRATAWVLQHPILAALALVLFLGAVAVGIRALWRVWRRRRTARASAFKETPADSR
jgi:erythromycin esterase-like protein